MNVVASGDSKFATAKWIVSPNISDGATHTTIAAALVSASSGDVIFIKPGTYTENITLKAGVNLVAYNGGGQTPSVSIVGKCTFTAAGVVTISGIRLVTNSDFFLEVSGTNSSTVFLENCYLDFLNNTGISFTSSISSSLIRISNCIGDIATTGIALYIMSSPGSLIFWSTDIFNTGNSTIASTNSDGVVFLEYSDIVSPLSNSGTTAGIELLTSTVDCVAINTTALTINSTSPLGGNFGYSSLGSGTASCLSIGAAATVLTSEMVFTSGNANVITGAGTFIHSASIYPGTTYGQNVSNIGTRQFGLTGTFVPTMTGGTIAGATTYSAQIGHYHLIGKRLFIDLLVEWTAASGTGDINIGGLPFAVTSDGGQNPLASVNVGSLTFPAGSTSLCAIAVNSSLHYIIGASGSGLANQTVQMINAGSIRIGGSYYID